MNKAHRIEIVTEVNDTRSLVKTNKFKTLISPTKVKSCKFVEVYTIEKISDREELQKIAQTLANSISQSYKIDEPETEIKFDWAIEIGYLPGVTDNVGHTAKESVEDLLKVKLDQDTEGVYTSKLFLIEGTLTEEEAKKIAASEHNDLIEHAYIKSYKQYSEDKGMDVNIPRVHLKQEQKISKISLDIPEEKLIELGKKGIQDSDGTFRGPLALDLDYINVIKEYFKKENRDPTDIELESIAQTWSEHCKHTIFAASMDDDIKDGLYKDYIKKATNEIRAKKGEKDFCVSVFKDNSGGITFDENWVITDKAETHNSPSALDPFGGAITGIVGVNRDTIGFGKGAKPIANKYGYCFADPNDTEPIYRDKALKNPALLPRTIIDGVVAGVNAGGNCSGIPTPQGWQYFDDRYKGKPLIFVGTIGLIPKYINGKPSWEKEAKAGDKIVMIGGRVGQDGIHGATFSSEALNEGSPATAVQIGDPITQKKFSDAIVKEARQLELYNSITDDGAGGLSCSVSEMARECGGCIVDLDKVPLKYPNLDPWKIWISESQERMTLSVPQEKIDTLFDLLKRRGVEATVIGEFTSSGRCIVKMHGETIMDIDLNFLHDGLPQKHLKTTYTRPKNEEPSFEEPKDLNKTLLDMMKRLNICGHEYISVQYDHIVQGHTVIYPLQGPGRVNNYATAIKPLFDSDKAVIMSQGITAKYSDIDTYHMAACAIDTAVRNAVALGASLDYMALMDNFCWCSSDEPERLGQLKEAARACYDYALEYETPYISGKDSMFNDFKGYNAKGEQIKISVPPTLLVSSTSVVKDVSKLVTMDPKGTNDLVYILGETFEELGASEYFAHTNKLFIGNSVPKVDATSAKNLYKTFKTLIDSKLIKSSISVTLGGLAVALAKKAISGQIGLEIDIQKIALQRNDFTLFSESQSRIIVTIDRANKQEFEQILEAANIKFAEIGTTSNTQKLVIRNGQKTLTETNIGDLTEAYRQTFKDF